MRHLLLFLLTLSLLTSCDVFKKSDGDPDTDNSVTAAPTGLRGPAYDPATSPVPMTAATPLPAPARATPTEASGGYAAPTPAPAVARTPVGAPAPAPAAQQQAAPRQTARGPVTYGSAPAAPQAAAPAQNEVAIMNPYGQEVAPSTYSAPAPGTAEAALAELLRGKWVNGTDEREIVEFSPDHYTTYYNGDLLFQEAMTYYANCPGDCNGGTPMEISCFTMTGPAGTDCYGVVRLTSTVLELSLLGVSTETITYYKL